MDALKVSPALRGLVRNDGNDRPHEHRRVKGLCRISPLGELGKVCRGSDALFLLRVGIYQTCFTLAGEFYRDRETDYEALMVMRNAPRWFKMLRKHGFITKGEAQPA